VGSGSQKQQHHQYKVVVQYRMQPKTTSSLRTVEVVDQRALKKRLSYLLKQHHNKTCAECPEKRPTWCSLIKPHPDAPVGTTIVASFICFQCAGIHRKLGTHICFVRSVSLDDWTESEVLSAERSGNDVVNSIYESNLRAMQSDNSNGATDVNIKPLQGAHAATRERYIRQKYIDLDFYSKHAHYQYQQTDMTLSPSRGMKSPGIRKKLGLFLNKDKSPLAGSSASQAGGGSLGKMLLNGGGSDRGRGSKSVCSSTVETSPSDDTKSILSAPTRIFSSEQVKAHLMMAARGTQSVCPPPTTVPPTTNAARSNRRIIAGTGGNASVNDFAMTVGNGTKNITGDENMRNNRSRSNSLGTDKYQNSMLQKTPSVLLHDSRRSAFHNSSKSSLNVSMADMLNGSSTVVSAAAGTNHGQGVVGTNNNNNNNTAKRRPSLVSAATGAGVSKPSPHNSRMKLYAQRSSSRGRSRPRDGPNEALVQRPQLQRNRSSSRAARDVGKENEIIVPLSSGDNNKSSIRRGRSRSNRDNRTNDISASAVKGHRDRSTSTTRDIDSSKNIQNRARSSSAIRRSKSNDIDGLGKVIQSRKDTSNYGRNASLNQSSRPGNNRLDHSIPDRSKSDDLTGMILIFDESCSNYDSDGGEPPKRQLPRRRSSSRRPRDTSNERLSDEQKPSSIRDTRSRSRSNSRSRRALMRELETPARPDSSRSRSRGRPDSQKSLPRGENLGNSPIRPRSSRSSGLRGSSNSLANAEESVVISPLRPRSRSESRGRNSSNSLKPEPSPISNSDCRRRSRSGDARVLTTTPATRTKAAIKLPCEEEPPQRNKKPDAPHEGDENVQATPERHRGGRSMIDRTTKDELLGLTVIRSNRLLVTADQMPAQQRSSRDRTKDELEPVQRRQVKSNKQLTKDGQDKKLASPLNSGENDFLVIASNSFILGSGRGSNHSADGPFNKSFQQGVGPKASIGGTERLIKDRRRCSRDKMATISQQRHARKSDIFASLDREENEVTAQEGPLLRMAPLRTKSSAMVVGGKRSLMIRPTAPMRSKSNGIEELKNPERL
jgi:hypothetical protein